MSRHNDAGASYDRTLLSNIPDPTRAEKQEGYNIDLLDEGRDRTQAATNPPDGQLGATDGYSPGAVAIARKEGQLENGGRIAKKGPWYRTRWGVTTIVIIIILIIGGVVGGAVGGTQHHSNSVSNPGGSTLGGQQNTGTPTSSITTSRSRVINPTAQSGTDISTLSVPPTTPAASNVPVASPNALTTTAGVGQGPAQSTT